MEQLSSVYPQQLTILTDVFKEIERQRPWEPLFPAGYTQYLPMGSLTPDHVSHGGTNTTGASTITSGASSLTSGSNTAPTTRNPAPAPTGSAAPTTRPQSNMVRNIHFNPVFNKFKEMNLRARPLKQRLIAQGVAFPTNARNSGMCITFHAMGVCNDQCKFISDHYKHTEAEDETLRAWCEQHYKAE